MPSQTQIVTAVTVVAVIALVANFGPRFGIRLFG